MSSSSKLWNSWKQVRTLEPKSCPQSEVLPHRLHGSSLTWLHHSQQPSHPGQNRIPPGNYACHTCATSPPTPNPWKTSSPSEITASFSRMESFPLSKPYPDIHSALNPFHINHPEIRPSHLLNHLSIFTCFHNRLFKPFSCIIKIIVCFTPFLCVCIHVRILSLMLCKKQGLSKTGLEKRSSQRLCEELMIVNIYFALLC